MSAHVLLILLNELGGGGKMGWDARLCRASYRFPPTSLIHSIIQDLSYDNKIAFKSRFLHQHIIRKNDVFA